MSQVDSLILPSCARKVLFPPPLSFPASQNFSIFFCLSFLSQHNPIDQFSALQSQPSRTCPRSFPPGRYYNITTTAFTYIVAAFQQKL